MKLKLSDYKEMFGKKRHSEYIIRYSKDGFQSVPEKYFWDFCEYLKHSEYANVSHFRTVAREITTVPDAIWAFQTM